MSVVVSRVVAVWCVLGASLAHAQVDCWAPRETQDSVEQPGFAPIRQTLLSLEAIIRGNAAYQSPPEPVRMRTTIAAGPDRTGGARIFVRAYPPVQTTADIRIWTRDRCDVIPQADRVSASIGEVYAFVNYDVHGQFLQGSGTPTYQGEVAGYPVYDGWVVMTKDRRLPWIPQTLGDRLRREEERRQRALDEWTTDQARRTPFDEAAQLKIYETFRGRDPVAAEKFLATVRETAAAAAQAAALAPATEAHLRRQVQAVRDYRAAFSAAELAAPAVWTDASRENERRLERRTNELQALTPADQQRSDALARDARDLERQARSAPDSAMAASLRERSAAATRQARAIRQAHMAQATFRIQDARAEYELANLRPGAAAQAMAFKVDPAFPDLSDPFRPQLITVNFWSRSNPKDASPRTEWLRQARATFDFAAVAALLR